MAYQIPCGDPADFEPAAFEELCHLFGPEWLLLTNIPRRISGNEIDACLVGPRGIVVLELKHYLGAVHCPKIGPWVRDGVPEKSKRPDDQAELCAQKLKARMAKDDASMSSGVYIHGAVLLTHPRCNLDLDSSIKNVGLLKDAADLVDTILAGRRRLSAETCVKFLKIIAGQAPPDDLLLAWTRSEYRDGHSTRTDAPFQYGSPPSTRPTQSPPPDGDLEEWVRSELQKQFPQSHYREPQAPPVISYPGTNYYRPDGHDDDPIFRKALVWISVLIAFAIAIGAVYVEPEIEQWWHSNPSPTSAERKPTLSPTPPKDARLVTAVRPQQAPTLAPSFETKSAGYSNGAATKLQDGPLLIWLDREPAGDEYRAKAIGYYYGKPAFTLRSDSTVHVVSSNVALWKLDSVSPSSTVVFSSFTGGAHCCTETKFVTLQPDGNWFAFESIYVDAGNGLFEFADLDHDGVYEILSTDQDFLYAFGCYACSYSPTRIRKITGRQMRDVTFGSKFAEHQRKVLKEMERNANWHSNGFLGGWVAQKAILGELRPAWTKMLASYDRDSNWDTQICLMDVPLRSCQEAQKRHVNFPEALRKLLLVNGYVSKDEAKTLAIK
jgi:hypothetical protein